MCGIAGILYFNQKAPDDTSLRLTAMCQAMIHRGPDEAGYGPFDRGALGMRRLSIIGVGTGQQPVYNADRSIMVVGNGEIYNYLDLREHLRQQGIALPEGSDIGVLPYLYERYGVDFVKMLRGMFALALWDARKQQLILVRDPLGKKPLYYARNGDRLVFASELNALLSSGLIDQKQLNPEAIGHYLLFSKVSTPLGALKGIHKVNPGHYLQIQAGKAVEHRYWAPSFREKLQLREPEYIEGIEQVLSESVRLRLQSEVPLGAFLSGGVDSSLVVAIMRKFFDVPVKTFSIGYEEAHFSELQHARKVARHLGTEHYEAVIKSDNPEQLFDLQRFFSEPFADSYLPLYEVSRLAKTQVTVVLTGDAGDENFGGYEWYKVMQWALWYQRFPNLLRRLVQQVSKILPYNEQRSGFFQQIRRIKYFAERLAPHYTHTADLYQALMGTESRQLTGLLQPDFLKQLDFEAVLQSRRHLMDAYDGDHEVERLMYAQLLSMLTDNFFTKVDVMSMAVSVEARCPFADQLLTEYAAKIPFSYKVKEGETKYILKKLAARYLPPEVVYRHKMGFGTPMQQWIKKGAYHHFFKDVLLSDQSRTRGIFNINTLEKLLQEHVASRANHYGTLWKALNLEMWCRHYLSETAANTK